MTSRSNLQIDMFGDDDPLSHVRHKWRNTIEGKGGKCPVCDRWGKVNVVHLNESMCLSLLWMSRAPLNDEGYIDMQGSTTRAVMRSRSYPHLAKWGFVEKAPKSEDKSKKSDGFWRVTHSGFKFIKNEFSVPDRVFTYNKDLEGWGKRDVFFSQCFGRYFDYEEVMKETFNFAQVRFSKGNKGSPKKRK